MSAQDVRALYENEERYQSVVRAMSEGVILQDAHSTILACNDAAQRLLGLTADQLMGRTSLDPRWRAVREDLTPFPGEEHPVPVTLRTGIPQRGTVMGVERPDGTITWLSINAEPLFREAEAKPYAAVCTFSDITQHKAALDQLRRSEERYRKILETTLEGVWMVDLTGSTAFANTRMADMLGCSLDELLSSALWSFIDESEHAATRERLAARARGIGELHDFPLRRKDGRRIWVSMATSAVTFADGSKGALAMVRDITATREMQSELDASRERLELALSVGQMGTWEWSLDKNVTRASRQTRDILGLPQDTPLTANVEFLRAVHPEDVAALDARMQAYIASGSTERFINEFRVVRPDGTVRSVNSAGRLYITSSGERLILGTVADVTEQLALHEQLQQAQRLDSIGRLAGGVAHDFNNLLTVILASVSFAQRPGSKTVAEDLDTIKAASERATELTGQLLAFARKQVIRLVSLDLTAVVRGLLDVLRRLVGENIVLVPDLAEDLWKTRGGASQLEQVIINLVVNARDALPEGGSIRIVTQNVPGPEDYVMVGVEDAGIGIDEAVLPRIFEPFFTTKRSGTGLGLASSYGIVNQLGGHIRVESKAGVGTTFHVYLPRETGNALPEERPVPTGPIASRSATILLVEDDELVRAAFVRSLVAAGHEVLVAVDGEDALAIAAAHTGDIDLVITDVVMPRKSGRQVAEAITRARPATKVLFVSGYTDDIIARHGVLEAGQNFLAKPVTVDALEERVAELLATRLR